MSTAGSLAARPPLVSIGMPVYNGAKYVAQAIDSVLAQDYPEIEIIVSDNASTDDTAAICERYAAADPRIRLVRNAENIGAQRNFGRVFAEARGRYFTWLAHDDHLERRDAIRLLVDVLERNPDVVLCGSGIKLVDHWDDDRTSTMAFPAIAADRGWRAARREFFRWPQNEIFFVIYGMYRRDVLANAPFAERRWKGRSIVRDIEFSIILPLLAHGRIVAVPEALRTYRVHPSSSYLCELAYLSGFDKFRLGLQTKLLILASAWTLELPTAEKCELLWLGLRNFLVANFRRPKDYQALFAEQRRELRILRRACDERLALIERQHEASRELLEANRALHRACDERLALIERQHEASRELLEANRALHEAVRDLSERCERKDREISRLRHGGERRPEPARRRWKLWGPVGDAARPADDVAGDETAEPDGPRRAGRAGHA